MNDLAFLITFIYALTAILISFHLVLNNYDIEELLVIAVFWPIALIALMVKGIYKVTLDFIRSW